MTNFGSVKEEIEQAAKAIKNGGVILYPTDTIWGLGCDPTNDKAIEKLLTIKKRGVNKSLILLVNNEALLSRYVKDIPEVCYDLLDYSDRPLTIVYPNGQYVSNYVLAEDRSIAIRLTSDEFCSKLIQRIKCGLVSTSANISNQPYVGGTEKIPNEIKDQVDYIVNLSLKNKSAIPSQIIKIGEKSEVTIIRK